MKNKVKIIGLFLSIVISAFFTLNAQTVAKPNIILIMTDQHQAEALSIVGNKNLKTPNLDQLAESGMLFNNSYVTFPLCTPSRSSIFTGKMPHTIGVNSNEKGDNVMNSVEKEYILAKKLQQAGYSCAYGGKWHAHEASMVEGNGFEMIAPMGDVGLAEKSIAYLKSKKDSKNPFFLTVSFDNPHNICEWARNEPLPYGNIEPVATKFTPELPINHKQSDDFPEVLQFEQSINKKVYPTANYTDEDWRQYRYTYYRLVEKVDAEIGKILNAIDDLDLRKNTLIIFTSDHGDGNASHGWNQKTALIQESIKVPFIASFEGEIKKNQQNNTLVSNGLDLYPTICAYANIAKSTYLTGENLKPIFESKTNDLERDFIVVETKFDGEQAYGTAGRAIIAKRYKYVLYNWGGNREQLFDLQNDPYELVNLALDTSNLKIVDGFRLKLYTWCKTTNDAFLRKIILPSTSKISSTELFEKPY